MIVLSKTKKKKIVWYFLRLERSNTQTKNFFRIYTYNIDVNTDFKLIKGFTDELLKKHRKKIKRVNNINETVLTQDWSLLIQSLISGNLLYF